MVATDPEITPQAEMDPSLQPNHQQAKNQTMSLQSLGRQSSIYSLTLDEFQHTLSESGKNFGSMNMDEFLNSIWTAEENQTQTQHPPPANGANLHLALHETTAKGLSRQGSLSIPEPLCRKTVDQVWSEIQKDQNHVQNLSTAQKQPTFGEMTLEDFLVRAGVVREQNYGGAPAVPPFGMFQNNPVVARPVMAVGVGVGVGNGYQARGGGYPQPPPAVGYGGGFGQVMASPMSPLSDGMGTNQVEAQYGMKRSVDGPVEKVVERRQRRMIKNRESAARSRARKQAYTVELEAELNQLKEENLQLKQALAELERKRKQQYYKEEEEEARQAEWRSKSYRANEKLRAMRRTLSLSSLR